ncbi:hypothetical protein [Achromobacter phage Motura]|uniref:Uncharacterized protein n=1 Tax=Achromobacter phage Motura TaxID=2591403 RepID=A0A514CSX9_9CAUD|nr:hypothetical protein H1O15_gp218 [Achromobacter phage Motura]QDH83570.1 hypothetical protein [Achromobacter phage Motura]
MDYRYHMRRAFNNHGWLTALNEKYPRIPVGCYACCKVVKYDNLKWIEESDGGKTAWCPHCDTDAITATSNRRKLQVIRDFAFSGFVRTPVRYVHTSSQASFAESAQLNGYREITFGYRMARHAVQVSLAMLYPDDKWTRQQGRELVWARFRAKQYLELTADDLFPKLRQRIKLELVDPQYLRDTLTLYVHANAKALLNRIKYETPMTEVRTYPVEDDEDDAVYATGEE